MLRLSFSLVDRDGTGIYIYIYTHFFFFLPEIQALREGNYHGLSQIVPKCKVASSVNTKDNIAF